MKTRYLLTAVTTAVLTLTAIVATGQAVKRPGPTRPIPPGGETSKGPVVSDGQTPARTTIDIRHNVKRLFAQNRVKSGKNLVYTSKEGVKLYMVSTSGRITGWEATDSSGQLLPVRFKQTQQETAAGPKVGCSVCVTIVIKDVVTSECYEIDCENLPKPKDVK